jgi:hypothetical protein
MPAFKDMPCSLFKLQLLTQTKTTKHPQISAENHGKKRLLLNTAATAVRAKLGAEK